MTPRGNLTTQIKRLSYTVTIVYPSTAIKINREESTHTAPERIRD
jgi:hypothetical protein